MSTGPKATFDFLAKSENRAATDLLISTLDSAHRAIREGGLAAILERLDPVGHREVFRRLATFDEHSQKIIQRRPGRLETVVIAAVKDTDFKGCHAACQAVIRFRLYEALPGLVWVLADETNPHHALAAQTILKLAEALYAELGRGDPQPQKSKTTDTETLRRRVTTTLEEATRKYFKHRQRDAVEAFLLVVRPQNAALRQLLRNPDDKCSEVLVDLLKSSRRGGVIRLLLGFLDEPQLPRPIIEILSGRRDKRFVKHLLRRIGPAGAKSRGCAETLSRFDSIEWLHPGDELLESLDQEQQSAAVHLLTSTSTPEAKQLEVLGHLLRQGNPGGRRAAARALAAFKGPEADVLVVKAISDEDPEVRASVIRQLRGRGIPGAILLLIRMVESPHAVIKEALRDALPEFSFRQFMMTFDTLPEESQLIAGHLVRQIDPDAVPLVAGEMKVLSPVRRRRAVQAASAMGLVKRLETHVAELVSDEDHMVRVAAAAALAESETLQSWEVLRDALFDRSVVVQEAAEQSLTRISHAFLLSLSRQGEEEPPSGGPPPEATPQEAEEVEEQVRP